MANKLIDLTGQRFGKLIVVNRASTHTRPSGSKSTRWNCLCDCGNYKIVDGQELKKGNVQSCGCFAKENMSKIKKKYNKYDLSGEYGVGYTYNYNSDGINYFYFDLEDYDKIKDYCWSFNDTGYLNAYNPSNKKGILMHRLILNALNNDLYVDHIKHIKYDNRKKYLRLVTPHQNSMNQSIRSDNTSGYSGIQINNNCKNIYQVMVGGKYIGNYETLEEAIEQRKLAVNKIFKEFGYENSMAVE